MSAINIPMPREQLERVVRQVVRERLAGGRAMAGQGVYTPNLVVNMSARHMHISQEDLEVLFGHGAQLTVFRWLYQPGEFAAEQQVTVLGPRRKMIEKVRILGPVRKKSQIELSFSDAFALGMDVPVRRSGDTENTPGCIVFGPAGVIELKKGVIRAERHVHMAPADAQHYGFADGQYVRLHVESSCSTTLERLLCRVHPNFVLEAHVDTDEGNACDLSNAASVELLH
jgi:putative phosphotransacetylase